MSGEGGSGRLVWTVGHSDRRPEELVALLASHGIARVVDVRSHPWSRRHPWHGRTELERSVRDGGIRYTWLGAALGGMRPEGFRAHQRSDAYQRGLEELIRLAREDVSAVLCAERDPSHCHRRFIADDLARSGLVVRHLLGPDEIVPHQPSFL
ncbi:MAG: DUF488 domain-containing protein [Acidobacteriota bacterium]|nr:DUF488 domain-containing protein [Acidobacteriota bacterium]